MIIFKETKNGTICQKKSSFQITILEMAFYGTKTLQLFRENIYTLKSLMFYYQIMFRHLLLNG